MLERPLPWSSFRSTTSWRSRPSRSRAHNVEHRKSDAKNGAGLWNKQRFATKKCNMALALESNVTSAMNATPAVQAKGAKLKKVANAFAPIIAVDRELPQPLHRQIYDAFRQAILGRKLQPGQQVPSTRALACELAVSRLPLLAAYAQLSDEGYFESRPGAGTYVSF